MRRAPLVADHGLPGLDGIRGIACAAVMGAHCLSRFGPESSPTGVAQVLSQGLTVFFALSGFLIYLPFAEDIAAGERRVRLGAYAVRRLARIYPAYVVIFLIANVSRGVYVANAVDVGRPLSTRGTGMIDDPTALGLNLSLLQTFFPAHLQTGINPSWSLTTELTFYAILPWLAVPLATWGFARQRRLLAAASPALALLVAGLVGRGWAERMFAAQAHLDAFSAEYGANDIAVLSRSLLGLADNFGLGMLVAVAFVWTKRGECSNWTPVRAVGVGWSLLGAGGVGGFLLHASHPWFTGTCMSVSAAALVLLLVDPTARGEASWLSRAAGLRPFEFIGMVSLSTYLWHFPVIIWLTRAGILNGGGVVDAFTAWLAVSVAAVGLGALTYVSVERPAMRGAAVWVHRAR